MLIYPQMQVEMEVTVEEEEITLDTNPELPPAEIHVEETPLEVQSDEAHPGSSTAELQQHEERREQEEETHEKPAGESHPAEPADGEATESLPDSSKPHEALESQESPETDMSQQPEHEEPAVVGEIQVMASSEEAAEEITQPEEPDLGQIPMSEVPSQVLQAPEQLTTK